MKTKQCICEHKLRKLTREVAYCDVCGGEAIYYQMRQSSHQEPDYEIGYCSHCMQSTNHLKEICQKCKPKSWKDSPEEDIRVEATHNLVEEDWRIEFNKKFDLDSINGEGVLPSLQYAVKQFISKLLTQSKLQHNQDCTREEWARASERERIVKDIEKLGKGLPILEGDIWMEGFLGAKQDIINIITNQ